jgi:hypothetical protein
MFKRAHPSFYAVPFVLVIGYVLTFNSMTGYQRLAAGMLVAFIALVGISLIVWPQDR